MNQRLDVSYVSILRVIIVLAALVFMYIIRDVIALVFASIFVSAAITPWVNWFHQRKFPRGMSVLIIYIIGISIFTLVVVLLIPPVTEQITQLQNNLPDFLQRVITGFSDLRDAQTHEAVGSVQNSLASLQAALASTTQGLFSTVSSIFGGIIFFAAMLVLTFYMVVNEELLKRFVQQITPHEYREYATKFILRSQVQLGKWLRGQLFLMLLVAILTYIGLSILGIKYALVLALIAGLFEFIPYAGPILSAVPAIIIALSTSPLLAILVVVLYFVIQQIENNILVPKVMQRAVGLNPIITIVSILIGAKLGGILGAVLAVPVVTVLIMFFTDVRDRKSQTTELA